MNEKKLTHFNESGEAHMVDVHEKADTYRVAKAEGTIFVNEDAFAAISQGTTKKGDVLGIARIAGIMGAKRTADLIPMCHPILLHGVDLDLSLNEEDCCVDIRARVTCEGKTGVEMEALTAAGTAALTIYDMCKAVQRDMVITDLHLVEKTGGVHGDYRKEEEA